MSKNDKLRREINTFLEKHKIWNLIQEEAEETSSKCLGQFKGPV